MFIGRESDLKFLEDQYTGKGGRLVILYGRRRIGKTATIRQFCGGKTCIFHTATELPAAMQLRAFGQKILQAGVPHARYFSAFADWEQAFQALAELPAVAGKQIVVIDEFPYMARADPALLSIIQSVWDNLLRKSEIMLILCGSSMSFMEKEVLSEKNPLYGRATGIWKMQAMPFADCARFFPGWSAVDKILAYAILGGIPHYLLQFDPEKPLAENVIGQILSPGSVLSCEVEFLMRQELREIAIYNAVIMAIALGKTRMNELRQHTGLDASRLSVYLRNLMDLGIVLREFSVLDPEKARLGNARGLYRLADNFFAFWYAHVMPNLTAIATGDGQLLWQELVLPGLASFAARSFEDVCRQHLIIERNKGKLPFVFTRIGRWWDKKTEIDILASNSSQSQYLAGECKFRNRPFNLADFNHLTSKFKPADARAKICYCVFSKGGFTDDLLNLAQSGEVLLYTTESLA